MGKFLTFILKKYESINEILITKQITTFMQYWRGKNEIRIDIKKNSNYVNRQIT